MNPKDTLSLKHHVESSETRKEEIVRQWTQLLLDWVKVCGYAHSTLDKVDFMDVVRMYGEDLFVECAPEALDRFLNERFPKLNIKLSDMADARNLYIVATVLLYHCITNGPDNAVINICLYLSLDQQALVQKFCEQLKGVEITVNTVDAAIAGAFENTSTSDVMNQSKKLQNVNHYSDPLDISEIKNETSETADISKKVDSIKTLYVKSLFVVKSSRFANPENIIPKTKDNTHRPHTDRTDTAGSDNTEVIRSDVSTQVNTTQDSKTEERKSRIREFLKKLDKQPIQIGATDLNVTTRKPSIAKKANKDEIQTLQKPSKKANIEATTPANNAPKQNFNVLFSKSSFAAKSSSIECPGNNRSQLNSDVTFLSTITSKEYKMELPNEESKTETIPESLKKLDHESIKHKINELHVHSHSVFTSAGDEDKINNDENSALVTPAINDSSTTTTNKPTKIIEKPVINDPGELNEKSVAKDPTDTIDTLYFKSQFSIKSSAFIYTATTESVPKSVTNTDSKSTTKKCLNEGSRKEFPTKDVIKQLNNEDKKMSNTPISIHSTDSKRQETDLNSELHSIKDEGETVETVENVIFNEPLHKHDLETEQIITEDPAKATLYLRSIENKGEKVEKVEYIIFNGALHKPDLKPEQIITEEPSKAIDTLYLKFPFITKSSAFGYCGKAISMIKKNTNTSFLTTVAAIHDIKSNEAASKVDEVGEVGMKTVDKHKDTSRSLKESDLEPKQRKLSTLKASADKVHTCIENYNNSKINTCEKSQCKSVTFKKPEPILVLETPETRSPIRNIDTLFMKFPFTVKSSAFGYINTIRANSNTVAEKTLPSTNKIAGFLKNCIVTTVEDIAEENKNNEISKFSEIEASGEPLHVVKEPLKPASIVVVEVANAASSKSPFTCKPSAMKKSSTSPRNKYVRVRDQTVYAESVQCSKYEGESEKLKAEKPGKGKLSKCSKILMNIWSKRYGLLVILAILVTIALVIPYLLYFNSDLPDENPKMDISRRYTRNLEDGGKKILINKNSNPSNQVSWECKNGLCQKVYEPHMTAPYKSHSRCTLLCTGPQLWPHPTGHKSFGNKIIALAINGIKYSNFVPSQGVKEYLEEAFILFQMDLEKLKATKPKEKHPLDLEVKDLKIEFNVEGDPDPRLRLDTEESYTLTIETTDVIKVEIKSPSFCGVRHGLETLSQLILLDQRTGYLITLTRANIKDTPRYKHRGVMIDTARNYIPVSDLSRTIDAMAMCKLNTFHWKISDAASFPMIIPDYPQLFEYGAYDRDMAYTAEDIKYLVERAGWRGIRVLIEVAAPGPVGRAWSWTTDAYSPPKNEKTSTSDILCLRLKMHESTYDVLEAIYTYIIKLTKVYDVFHLSNGLFSFVNCFGLIEDREHFLDRALNRLRIANNGTLPRLPLIWYNADLMSRSGWTWNNFGIQLHEHDLPETVLNKYRLIQSSRWDLSCEMDKHRCVRYRTWQEMYNWRTWRDLEVLTIEGGEAVLWTDLVDGNNLDSHLWPRTAAVAERLWSDAMTNQSASPYEYLRLDAQRWRMLIRGVRAQTVWPMWCSFHPGQCFNKIKT